MVLVHHWQYKDVVPKMYLILTISIIFGWSVYISLIIEKDPI